MRIAIAVVIVAMTLVVPLAAAEKAEAAKEQPKPVNTVCPIMGDPVEADVEVVVVDLEKDGKTVPVAVGLCCDDCVTDIQKDPQRFAAAALENKKAPKKKK
ncbi:MAG TPA: hypothetical protein VEL07_01125 [Planctomycetota bacterium]|nr:hypothetical protein [Planctomycetota bacterium]